MGFWKDRVVAITGGSGSLGRALTRRLLREDVRAIRLIARGEFQLHRAGVDANDGRVRTLIGDVRDCDRMMLALNGVDAVFHCAALKRIDMAPQDPFEFIATNVRGTEAVVNAARERWVERVMVISSDKACQPTTIYGHTKALAEALSIAANVYGGTKVSAARYGNVCGSRGSLIPLLLEQRKAGRVTKTARGMSRFFMRMSEAVELVITSAERMEGREVFVPKLPSTWVDDIFTALAPDCAVDVIGLRAVEKMHEALVAFDESRSVEDAGDRYIIRPGTFMDTPGFSYTSDTNPHFLSVEDIRAQVESAMAEAA